MGFAALVLLVVVVTRLGWVMSYRAILGHLLPGLSKTGGDLKLRVLIGWSGMRGVLTMATAMSLPAQFPGRDVIVLSAFAVVLGTLVIQGATIAPMIRWLGIPPDVSLERDIKFARAILGQVGEDMATKEIDDIGHARKVVDAQREALQKLLSDHRISQDTFKHLQEELDWRELSLTSHSDREIKEA
jgi:CPA1 family monovalent cation:H+ antiporter